MKSLIIDSKKFGKVAVLYDDVDHNLISQYNWYIIKLTNCMYAISTTKNESGKLVLMHRLILGINNPRIFVDHKNGCGIDNTRENIRIATKSQNAANQNKSITNTSGHKGVYVWNRSFGTFYRARICVNNKNISLGCYRSIDKAIEAYNTAAIKYFGEFTRLN